MTAPRAILAEALDPDLHTRYLALVERRLGLRLSPHQAQAIPAAISAVLRTSGHATAEALYAALAATGDSTLIDLLGADLTIGETHFYRITPQIDALRHAVLPDILRRRAGVRRLGIWSAGCSTGEEPYTLAMLLRDVVPAAEYWDIQLLASDLSFRAIAAAREALYGDWSFRETPEPVRSRYFMPDGKRWRLVDTIKRMVTFSHLNLTVDAFPSPGPTRPSLDLILCRNVTIYFSPEACQRLYRRLAEALTPGGWLVLGPSDPTPSRPSLLEPVAVPGAIFWRRVATSAVSAAPSPPDASFTSAVRPIVPALAGRPMRPGMSRATSAAKPRDTPRVGAGSRAARPEPRADALPADAERHLLLGLKYLDEGDIEKAIASLRRAAYLHGNHGFTQFSLGKAYLHGGDRPRARAAFSHARRLLAGMPADKPVDEGGEMTAEELRYAVDAHLAALGGRGQ